MWTSLYQESFVKLYIQICLIKEKHKKKGKMKWNVIFKGLKKKNLTLCEHIFIRNQ